MPRQAKQATATHLSAKKLHADRLIVATNRGPVEYYRNRDHSLKSRQGSGGVVTALSEAMQGLNATWIALAMTEGDRQAMQDAPNGLLPSSLHNQQIQLHYVAVPKKIYRKHYDIISNQVLWFLQHYLADTNETPPSAEELQDAWEHGYKQTNQAIADAICAELARDQSSAVVMLQDYQLYLVPELIRQCQPSAILHHFIHIPWPEVRYWQSVLPTAFTEAIYNSLLSNDIVGFQTRRDAQNFLEGVGTLFNDIDIDEETRTIMRQNHRTLVRDYPISISVSEERRLVKSAEGKRATKQIQPLLGQQTIVRVDRIEPTKNIVQGFRAYEHLLDTHPELLGQVTFLAFLVPSRQSLPTYKHYQAEVLKSIKDINQRYGREGWTPIQAFVQNDRTLALAALQFYDALLVNPLFDGMNLVAKEGAVLNQKNGVLVLSRTSGAFQQLGDASLPISPNDTNETADALHTALTLPEEERKLKAEKARQEVEQHDLTDWMTQQIHDLNTILDQSKTS